MQVIPAEEQFLNMKIANNNSFIFLVYLPNREESSLNYLTKFEVIEKQ